MWNYMLYGAKDRIGMKYCMNCGQGNSDEAKFCNRCGTPLQPEEYQQRQRGDFERKIDDFAQEMGSLGNRIGKEFERGGNGFESLSDRKLGIMGPLIWSLVGLAVLVIIIGVLYLVGDTFHVLRDISDFLLNNIWLLFGLGLLFSYSNFFSRRYREKFKWVQPVFTALGLVFALWIASEVLHIVAVNYTLETLEDISSIMAQYLGVILIVVLVVGYVALLVTLLSTTGTSAPTYSYPTPRDGDYQNRPEGDYRRLYRSGRNRILGGVCGGMGEYANVDPNIIRLIWIILLVVTFGLAILAYFICWIVIPRNPNDIWA